MTTWIDRNGKRRGARNHAEIQSPHDRRRAERVAKSSKWIAELVRDGKLTAMDVRTLHIGSKPAARAIADRLGLDLQTLRVAAKDAMQNEGYESDASIEAKDGEG